MDEFRANRKRRTRQHVIADLAVNHVERFVLRAGFTAQTFYRDYGLDMSVSTFDEEGRLEPGLIFFQVKATDHIARFRHGAFLSVPVDERDVQAWIRNPPVFLILFDVASERAYWGNVSDHFDSARTDDRIDLRKFRTMKLRRGDRLNDAAMLEMALLKARISAERKGSVE